VGEGTGKILGIQAIAYTDKKDIVALLRGELEKSMAVVEVTATPKGTCPVRAALSVPRPVACSTSCSTEMTR